MADEFHTGLCSTMSWWNTMRSPTSFDFPLPLTPPPISCATESISWSTQPFLYLSLLLLLLLLLLLSCLCFKILCSSRRSVLASRPAVDQFNQMQMGFGDSSRSDHDQGHQALLPGLTEPTVDMIGDLQPASWPKFSSSSTPAHYQLSRVSSPSKHQLSFCNNTPFRNPSAKIPEPRFEDESTGSNLIAMKGSETKRHGSDRDHQPPAKKARIATPSPLPTFKVRKEKLGDRITALQQLVSPFGKTDTASVLHEAIDYIKFLHGQVGALSTPYLKTGHQMQHRKSMESSNDEGVQDLRSRGLCLVPISSTFAVASETPMEFWAPTFLGSYS